MSKFIFVKYKEKHLSDKVINNLTQLCDLLSPEGLQMTHQVYENSLCSNSFIGIQNSIEELEEKSCLLLGHINTDINQYNNIGDPLPDGSYSLIRFNEKDIEFFCDKFCSRTLWYYFDDKKLIVSNSQRAIVSLKGDFLLNRATVSWFLSSGSQGPFLSWDKDIEMVRPNEMVQLNIDNWTISKTKTIYHYENQNNLLSVKDYNDYYAEYTKKSISKLSDRFKTENLILPLSGGYDSRLLLYISGKIEKLSNITTINWGKKNAVEFDDKAAANLIAKHYNINHINKYLPESIQHYEQFLEKYIKLGDCRIDHFNAFTDNFKLWEELYKDGFKILIRGDIPFTEGLDLNLIMSRAHIGINTFADYNNIKDYNFGLLNSLQDEIEGIKRKKNESLIKWRDRLYVNYRLPLVIGSFSDLINAYIENRSPMISGELFLNYSKLKDKNKGNKKHIVKLSEKMDKSKVSFMAAPSLPAQAEIFKNEKGILFLKSYLQNCDNHNIFGELLVDSVLLKMTSVKLNKKYRKSVKAMLKSYLSNNLPPIIKGYLKSKDKLYLDPIAVAYRIVMIDIAIKMYNEDAQFFK